jgi:pimeloyl-ACP methyl ester carboxylesterase
MPATTPDSHPSRNPIHWRSVQERLGIDIHPGTGAHTVLFAHGLGCSAAFFESAVSSFHLRGVTHVRLDFLDHGGEDDARLWRRGGGPVKRYPDPMEAFADQLEEAFHATHRTGTVHLVSHSMGTVPALILHTRLRRAGTPLTGRFISIEGNLTGGDCGLASREIAAMGTTYDGDWEGLDEGPLKPFLQRLDASSDMAERRWGAHMRSSWPPFLTHTAKHLVQWCDSGRAADLWSEVDNPVYIYGERTGYPEHNRDLLDTAAMAEIPGSGHFPMIDNASALWQEVARALKESSGH